MLAIELAGDAAAGSFRSSIETLTGNADLEVTAIGGVPDEVVGRLATLPYAIQVRPRIEDYAVVAGDRSDRSADWVWIWLPTIPTISSLRTAT